MKKGFTLLELIIVIIIIGVLATLGFTQYAGLIEKARGAEARSVISNIRTKAAAYFVGNNNNLNNLDDTNDLGLSGDIPTACTTTNYFSYGVSGKSNAGAITVTATRCTSGGKSPNATTANTLVLTSNLGNGTDTYSGYYK